MSAFEKISIITGYSSTCPNRWPTIFINREIRFSKHKIWFLQCKYFADFQVRPSMWPHRTCYTLSPGSIDKDHEIAIAINENGSVLKYITK